IVIISGGVDLSPGAVIALSGVVAGELFVEGHWSLAASALAGLLAGFACGILSAILVVGVRLPPFIATLGVMGIARGAAFIITKGRYFDVSGALPPGWRLLGIPLDWTSPILMIVLALIFQWLMTGFQWGRAVFAVGGNETAALFSGVSVARVQASVYTIAAVLAAMSGIALAVVQGQGKADLAMGYELDIIASAVVGGASLAGGRGSVAGLRCRPAGTVGSDRCANLARSHCSCIGPSPTVRVASRRPPNGSRASASRCLRGERSSCLCCAFFGSRGETYETNLHRPRH